jgi:hypothetical protein
MSKSSVTLNMKELNESDMKMPKLSVDAIPNLEELIVNIYNLVNEIDSPEMRKLREVNNNEFKKLITHKYMNVMPRKSIDLMLDDEHREENIERYLYMLELLTDVKNNKITIDEANERFMENLKIRYLYTSFGGKEQYEKKMKELEEEAEREKNKNKE